MCITLIPPPSFNYIPFIPCSASQSVTAYCRISFELCMRTISSMITNIWVRIVFMFYSSIIVCPILCFHIFNISSMQTTKRRILILPNSPFHVEGLKLSSIYCNYTIRVVVNGLDGIY